MSSLQSFIEHIAYNLRYWSIVTPAKAGSGHTTTCLSAADIVATLFFYAMEFDPDNYENPDNDRFILSKGHASPLLYAIWHELGKVTDADMMTYRDVNSVLEGHPTLRFSYTEAATGALGIGLSIGAGEALCAKLDRRNYKTFVLLGDGETAEGAVWEAAELASYYKLNNLIGIIDCNRLGQTGPTLLQHHIKKYEARFAAFGWHVFGVNGHDVKALMEVFDQAKKITDKPVMIVAETIKGYGVEMVADKNGWHGKAFKGKQVDEALRELKSKFSTAALYSENFEWKPTIPKKVDMPLHHPCSTHCMPETHFQKGNIVATRKIYGEALSVLGDECEAVVSLDAEVKNSTFAEIFEKKHPDRFFQCFIAEQNMVGMGIGFDRRGRIPFISTFSAFMSRAHDQIRMAAIGSSTIKLVGSHCGVSIGQDGPSQMGLEDLAMMRSIPNSVVLYPSDAVSTYKLVHQMACYDKGISYLRTTRMATPIIYDNNEPFPIGGCKVVKQSSQDKVCVIGAGVTLHEALKAHEMLKSNGIAIAVIDLYSVKPIDADTIVKVAQKSGNKIITVEDHYPEGGIGEAVMGAVINHGIHVEQLAVEKLPRSGKPEELLALYGIDADAIVMKVKEVL